MYVKNIALSHHKLTMRIVDGMELLIIITAVFVQAMLGQARAINVINALIVWRFIVSIPADSESMVALFFLVQLGIGIGGDYPTSVVIASEFEPMATRGRMLTGVFATQGLGQLGTYGISADTLT